MFADVKERKNGLEIVECKNKPVPDKKYVIYNTALDTIYPLHLYTILVHNEEKFRIAGKLMNKKDCIPLLESDGLKMMEKNTKKLIQKSAIDTILSPFSNTYPPFTKAVVMAIIKDGIEVALTPEMHNKKTALIRECNKRANTDVDISMKKAEELLGMFNIRLNSIFKPEYT